MVAYRHYILYNWPLEMLEFGRTRLIYVLDLSLTKDLIAHKTPRWYVAWYKWHNTTQGCLHSTAEELRRGCELRDVTRRVSHHDAGWWWTVTTETWSHVVSGTDNSHPLGNHCQTVWGWTCRVWWSWSTGVWTRSGVRLDMAWDDMVVDSIEVDNDCIEDNIGKDGD